MDTETRWLTEDEQVAWRSMLHAQSMLMSALDRELTAEHGLGLPDYDVLVQLSESRDRSLRMTDLAHKVLLSPSGLTRRLDGLVKQGFVERKPCPSDGRGLLAVLTEKGVEKMGEMAPTHLRGVRSYFVDRVEPEQLKLLTEVFTSLIDAQGGIADVRTPATNAS